MCIILYNLYVLYVRIIRVLYYTVLYVSTLLYIRFLGNPSPVWPYILNIFSRVGYVRHTLLLLSYFVDEWQIFSCGSFCTREWRVRSAIIIETRRGCRTRRISKGPRVTCRAHSAIRLFDIIIIIISIITLLSVRAGRWTVGADGMNVGRLELICIRRDARPKNKRVMAGVVRPPPPPRERRYIIIIIIITTIAIYFYYYYYYYFYYCK